MLEITNNKYLNPLDNNLVFAVAKDGNATYRLICVDYQHNEWLMIPFFDKPVLDKVKVDKNLLKYYRVFEVPVYKAKDVYKKLLDI